MESFFRNSQRYESAAFSKFIATLSRNGSLSHILTFYAAKFDGIQNL